MKTVLTLTLIIFIAVFALRQITSSLGALIAPSGNRLARRWGLQADYREEERFAGREAIVVAKNGDGVRVEFEGTTWAAFLEDGLTDIAIGEVVRITGVEGASRLRVERKNGERMRKGDSLV